MPSYCALKADTQRTRLRVRWLRIMVNGSAKGWVNFNGTGTVATRDSLNVSSILDEGTGDYTVNFTNSMSNADYNHVAGGQQTLSAANREIKIRVTQLQQHLLYSYGQQPASGNIDFAFISVQITEPCMTVTPGFKAYIYGTGSAGPKKTLTVCSQTTGLSMRTASTMCKDTGS